MSDNTKCLHWVYKIGSLSQTLVFYNKVLGLKVLRHEEFDTGCDAACNGPYASPWSKTMIGDGPECQEKSSSFSLELTYNYGIDKYTKGNDLRYVAISDPSGEKAKAARELEYTIVDHEVENNKLVTGPDGYQYLLYQKPPFSTEDNNEEQFLYVSLNCSDLRKTREYWVDVLGFQVFSDESKSLIVGPSASQTKLEFVEISEPIDHAKAYGRIAFATKQEIKGIAQRVRDAGHTILTEPIVLDTPGKASVEVVILADPDGYEICFVGEEAFIDLSTVKAGDEVVDWAVRQEKGADTWIEVDELKQKLA